MAGKRLNEAEKRKRSVLIQTYVSRGYSANRIQRELQKKGLGMRRQNLLKEVREARKREYRELYRRKAIAVYGTVRGESRRLEMYGTGRQLYRAMQDAVNHPPKKRFVECYAWEVGKYLDYLREWDDRPEVDS